MKNPDRPHINNPDQDIPVDIQGPVCPLPYSPARTIVLGHGSGGKLTHDLVASLFLPPFNNPALNQGDDGAVISTSMGNQIVISTDTHVVSPLFFPGGDIGRLAVCGTVNDLAVMGATPQYLTAGFILEEGLDIDTIKRIVSSMQSAAREAGVEIVAGDTKVVQKGKGDGIFINTAGYGERSVGVQVSGSNAKPGDLVILSGPIGDHGIAVLCARGDLGFISGISSDVAPLNHLVAAMLNLRGQIDGECPIHVMRDPTRGGLATSLNEISRQSKVCIQIHENQIPISPAVSAACEILGFDPLYIANEGKLIAIVNRDYADQVLAAMRSVPYGDQSEIIGEVLDSPSGRVLMKTALGSTRVIDMLSGELLPRIC